MRRAKWLLPVLALLMLLAACGEEPSAPAGTPEPQPAATEPAAPEPTEEPAAPVADALAQYRADALEQYRIVVGQADTYLYDPDAEPSGNYRYALVQMQPEDTAPTLLLEQETTDYLYYALVFRYDPESGSAIQLTGSLMEGMSQMGGYRGGLTMQGDGNGIRITEMSGGTGQPSDQRLRAAEQPHLLAHRAG